jgi:hypothetical protein
MDPAVGVLRIERLNLAEPQNLADSEIGEGVSWGGEVERGWNWSCRTANEFGSRLILSH